MWTAIALAFGLAMDATAVSAARALGNNPRRELVILPLVFGGFQAAMAALGWAAGATVGPYIARWDHWVAFALLVLIGAKMLRDAIRGEADDAEAKQPTAMLYVGLGIATSIDAAAAGLTLPLVPVAPWISLTLIGAITAACSLVGVAIGRFAGEKLGARLGVIGGLVLIGMGINLLLQALR
jgi:manganese efflux pump family protein